MTEGRRYVPLLVVACIALLMALYGPIAQPPDYHHFADVRSAFGMRNAADVLSNIGFAAAGWWGWLHVRGSVLARRPGYLLFLGALVLTAAGSFFYHLAPDDARLVWDRIPIALACAGLLAGVHADCSSHAREACSTVILAMMAVTSVAWWSRTGDLRPYLMLQALPLVLIPLWQWSAGTMNEERRLFAVAILLYILAKAAELNDHEFIQVTGIMSGHTLKHLLATGAAFIIVSALKRRT